MKDQFTVILVINEKLDTISNANLLNYLFFIKMI